jgi:hypothetical protein
MELIAFSCKLQLTVSSDANPSPFKIEFNWNLINYHEIYLSLLGIVWEDSIVK